jgi:glycine cleavage system H protein
MESFHYVDIFATKGIEYIIVLGFLFILIYFWQRLNRRRPAIGTGDAVRTNAISLVDWFTLADNYLYHQGHSWAAKSGDNRVKIGVDDFVQKLIGRVDKVTVPEKGSLVKQGQAGMKFEIDGKQIPVLSPVDGTVTAVNEDLVKDTGILQDDPYGQGWLFEVRPGDWKKDRSQLLSGELAKAWLRQQVDRISELMTARMGVVMQDGGSIAPGFARELEPEKWAELTRDFLMTR